MTKKKFAIDWGNALKKIQEQAEAKTASYTDEREFKPKYKQDGTFQAVIRFLPSKDTDIPFIDVYSHGFKGPGGWFVDNCPTTIKKKCPVCTANSAIWDEFPDVVRKRKRKLSYYANILVINDIQTPENNGKVFLYRFGKKIHDKIMQKLNPPEGGILKPVTVFDYYEGANFNLMIKKVKVGPNMLPNYDDSNFDSVSTLGDDDEIEKIHGQLFGLKDYHAESNFKSWDELKEKHDKVVGQTVETEESEDTGERVVTEEETEPVVETEESIKTEKKSTKKSTKKVEKKEDEVDMGEVLNGDDDSFFENLQTE